MPIPARRTVSLQLAAPLMALLLGACASTPPECAQSEHAVVVDTLYFGTQVPGGGSVDDRTWQRFIDEAVTPRFPQGFTQWTAQGQWRDSLGVTERERSWVLQVAHADTAVHTQALDEIAASYRQRFGQEAVMRLRNRACLSY